MNSFKMPLLFLLLVITMLHQSCNAKHMKCSSSYYSSCGNISNITSPFRLTTDPSSCGDLRYNLSCENNITVLNLPVHDRESSYSSEIKYQRFYVREINYNNYTIRVVDPKFHKHDENYSTLFANNTLSLEYVYGEYAAQIYNSRNGKIIYDQYKKISKTVVLISCERRVVNSSYIDATPCMLRNDNNNSFVWSYYLLDADEMSPFELDFCLIQQVTLIDQSFHASSCHDINRQLAYGFQLSWIQGLDKSKGHQYCYLDENSNEVHCHYSKCQITAYMYVPGYQKICNVTFVTFIRQSMFQIKYMLLDEGRYKYTVGLWAPRTIIGLLFIIYLMVYKWRRRHLSMYNDIEEFLQSHNNLIPIRYSYRDIKKITKGFKEKLGEGGFGSVYKGQLCSGPFVAVKMLGKCKTNNGQDFINEVATIGKVHHVNIVRLIGFCVEGKRWALIYDFMANGSLDKYIFSQEKMNVSLCYAKVFEISVGIARGIEYLHQGCEMHILHFDIKPHNILLDENFIPKVSDFGLARSCSLENNLASLTAARGTLGYIAPELFYKNIGRVSTKSDVYSFGMLLMEMANQRKNVNAETENSSRIFFPIWIHKQFNKGKDIEINKNEPNEDWKTIKKMIIVALWCIQLKPCDRPTMSTVIEMLESNIECLQVPPNLHIYPQNQDNNNNETYFSSTISVDEYSTDVNE
ncbi:LEAF RUST 10 DISEASE-RESISTANCE LOCUS RECEPTOR-LIKE PROTEIN KINASE-like 2.1 [Cannabis sativa]|nr:LEAF RUST 10 DISEASE-RESISTANCE LOCUS RECEPTOR-LIKE PROTEIN KINASE-like 2.1 [Cannabis sativa]